MVGDKGFDPMRISDQLPDLRWARAAEIKNGRVAMLAIVGMLWQENLPHIPGGVGYSEMNPLKAVGAIPTGAHAQIFGTIMCIEFATSNNWYNGDEPGNLGWGSKMLDGKSAAQVKDMKEKEISHCRLAMMAIAGAVTQTLMNGEPLLGGSF